MEIPGPALGRGITADQRQVAEEARIVAVEQLLVEQGEQRDVAFVPGWPFYAGPPDRATLRLSFTAHPEHELREGLTRLRAATHALR